MCSKDSFEEEPIEKAKLKEMEVKDKENVEKVTGDSGLELSTLGL